MGCMHETKKEKGEARTEKSSCGYMLLYLSSLKGNSPLYGSRTAAQDPHGMYDKVYINYFTLMYYLTV